VRAAPGSGRTPTDADRLDHDAFGLGRSQWSPGWLQRAPPDSRGMTATTCSRATRPG